MDTTLDPQQIDFDQKLDEVTSIATRLVGPIANGGHMQVSFPNDVLSAQVQLHSFDLHFPGADHHVHRLFVRAYAGRINGKTVTVYAIARLEDQSGHVANGHLYATVTAYLG